MALLPTGSENLIEIRTSKVDVVIRSKGKRNGYAPGKESVSSSLKIIGFDVKQIYIPAQEIVERFNDHKGLAIHEYPVSPLFFEQTDYIITIRSNSGEALSFRSNNSLIDACVNRVIDDDPTLMTGVFNFGNNVGYSDIIILAESKQVLHVRLEVYPTKVSYQEDYREMMADLNNMVSESILDFMKKTYQVFVPDHKRNDVPAVFFTILQGIYNQYLRAVNRIVSVPHHKLVTEYEVLPHFKVSRTDTKSERWLRKHTEFVIQNDKGIQAEKILSVKKQITYDTQENRLVKFMLTATVKRIDDFTQRYIRSKQQPDEHVLDATKKMSGELRRLLTTTFLSDVSDYHAPKSMSLVFGMAPGYRELYKYYLMLQNGISVGGEIFQMSVRETAQLYEYWCFIKLYDILRSRYTLKSPDIIRIDRTGVTVDLVKGRPSKVTFLNTRTGELIYLAYNPSEISTQTVSQRPDNVLELEKRGSLSAYKYVFDAKYRIEMNPDGVFYPDTRPGPKVDDINTMHRYRDSIVYQNPKSRFTFEKTMFGAYILFPYSDENKYKEHRFYKSIETVNIGGLPFLPSATSLVTDLLEELISDSSESAFERTTLPAGIEERLRTVDWSKREVLIGLVPDALHLNLFLNNNVYFTRKFDTVNLPVRYVALYEKGKGINWYGEVISWGKDVRGNLPGSSEHPSDDYHVFKVLNWTKIEEPIVVSEYGPNPIAYTNHFLLLHSSSYSELMLKSEADYRFFTELKRRTDETVIKDTTETTAFEFGDTKVLFDKSNIYVYISENQVYACTVWEFSKHPNATFRRIQRYAEMLNLEKGDSCI